jgi:hypothetical protein
MSQYIINLTEAEDLALSCVALSQDEWIQNATHERCRVAIEEIVSLTVAKCLETNTQIPQSKEEIVFLARDKGWIRTAAQVQAEHEANIAAQTNTAP